MTFSVQDARANIQYGGARPTLFQVSLSSPFDSTIGTVAPFMISGTELPPSTLGIMKIPYMGRTFNVAGDRTFDPWRINVFNDEDFKIRHAFEEWHNMINSVSGNINNTGSSSPNNYKVNADINQFSKVDDVTPIRTYRFYGVFPSDIGAITLSWDAQNQFQTFPATLQYDWYEVVSGTTGTIT